MVSSLIFQLSIHDFITINRLHVTRPLRSGPGFRCEAGDAQEAAAAIMRVFGQMPLESIAQCLDEFITKLTNKPQENHRKI